jgi:ABC-type polysaccharide/polyol phosphate export permease
LRVDYPAAIADLILGLANWRIWGRLGWLEVKRRYRRTILGPIWVTLTLAIFCFAMGFVYAELFHREIATYLPFLTTGMVCWGMVSGITNDGCSTYVGAESLIKQLKFPLVTLNCIVVWRNIIVLAHNMIIVVVMLIFFPVPVNWALLLFIPGVLIIAVNGLWATLVLGMVSVRFRDIPPLVSSLVTAVLFITPIFWPPDQLGASSRIITYNYFYHLTNLIRAPLLGETPALESYLTTIGGAVLGGIATIAIYARFRQRIVYWL